ncbi:endospore coat-associated protein [Paenibacillus oryzae]|uniref:Endospore coat-associated protein n=1 Tax=Paenibacillus oryzae TaxID=1844972 RepID=A0A1A5YMC3_9BACL|nr:YheC/YheD family protein [Paenibacillus oryzae]OBR66688.1 endospore coat-associated protein [Paenibacillus oryzae]
MSIRRVRSKWAKTKVLMKSPKLVPSIPLTKVFNRDSLHSLLQEYGMVYVKPMSGTFGKGVIRVEAAKDSSYRYQTGTSEQHASSFDELYRGLQRITGTRNYLVQQGIHLLKHRKRRFDLRVMVQRNPRGSWETTGIIGRLSHPDKIVTNYHNGGTMMSFQQLMAGHLSGSEMNGYLGKLRTLGVAIGKQLSTAYPGLKELGVDVAIDTRLKPWVLEVNTKPHPYIFNKLSDKSMHRKVVSYARAYGGIKRKSK